ncbi:MULTISPECIES: ABC transporter permease [unclassified Meiothermus]|uniref:ABC transporter permease n=1 Tax=unclassified Meiothermus TaxID=370471 RepID=UPI000D7CE1A1|nr:MULTISPECIES: ABC transporter permease [unclassified Meiothermus]PZA06308.1 ABC transporter permease [Meiothermus sp. Pnk-1]RYM36366.1 ABC transporter permease [Meiothermus sp. PNK-Is4]
MTKNPLSFPSLRTPAAIALGLAAFLLVLGEVIRPGFAEYNQITNILRIAAFLGIVAIGQTLVILAGGEGIDLSVGAVVTLGAILIFRITGGSDALLLPALVAALLAGFAIGLVNGVGIAWIGIPPLVMTLGMMGVVKGLILVYTGGRPQGGTPPLMKQLISDPWVLGIPGDVFIWALLGIAVTLLLQRTAYGKALYAIGANRIAARLSGVHVERTVILTYGLSGMFAALGGFVLLGYIQNVFINLGDPYTLPSIAAVVVGGTALAGGVGGYAGTMAGALVLTLVSSLLITLGLPEFGRQITYGLILLALLALYGRERRLRG